MANHATNNVNTDIFLLKILWKNIIEGIYIINKLYTMALIININEPCGEDWSAMQPDEKGKFCLSCNKSVYDFTDKSDAFIQHIIRNNAAGKICGRFMNSQINRPLGLTIQYVVPRRRLKTIHVFALATFFVFGTFLFSCKNEAGQKYEYINIEEPAKDAVLGEPSIPDRKVLQKDSTENLIPELIEVQTEYAIAGGISYIEYDIPDSNEIVTEIIAETPPQIELPVLGGISYSSTETDEVNHEQNSTEITNSNLTANDIVPEFKVFPNPSNGEGSFSYELKKQGRVMLELFDMTGSKIKSIVPDQIQHSGKYVVPFNFKDLENGIYFARIIIDGKENHQEIVIAK